MAIKINRNADYFGNHLGYIAKHYPTLTHEETIELAFKVQRMQALKQSIENKEQQEQSEEEIAQVISEGEAAKLKIYLHNLAFVTHCCKKYDTDTRNIDIQDLVQAGYIGLMKAVEKFDPSKGYRFSTYAYWHIKSQVSPTIAKIIRPLTIPSHIYHLDTRARKITAKLSLELQRSPTMAELAAAMQVKSEQIQKAMLLKRDPVSIEGREEDGDLGGLHLYNERDTLDAADIDKITQEEVVAKLMTCLNEYESWIIKHFYGLGDAPQLSIRKMVTTLEIFKAKEILAIKETAERKMREYAQSLGEDFPD